MRVAGIMLVLVLAASTSGTAQTYGPPSPVPRTTSIPALHAQATSRLVEERFARGLAALDRREWPNARDEFAAIVALNPPEPKGSTALYDLAIAQANNRETAAAAASLRGAIARDPGFLAAMANLIAIDAERGDIAEARSVADRFVSVAPDSARALYARGVLALRQNDLATAKDDFGKLLRNDPQYAVAHYDLAIAESGLNAFDAAEREFRTALELAPHYARARFGLGTVLLRRGARADARVAFDAAAADAGPDVALRSVAVEMRNAIAPH